MLIYDAETVKAIRSKKRPPIPSIKYCGGWRDFEGMGISCIGVYDYDEDRYRVFLEDNFDEFARLIESTDMVIGFNNLAFDDPLVAATCGVELPSEKSYDLLAQIWIGAGLSYKFSYPSHLGFGLAACCEVNFGVTKSGHGDLAPIQWQKGERGAVIDYCLNDVWLTKRLFDLVATKGEIVSPKGGNGTRIQVWSPEPRW